jgi:hypothetical protein
MKIIVHIIFIVSALISLQGCSASRASSLAQHVSLVQVLSNPAQYDRKVVVVKGYYSHSFESSGLYLCEEHARYPIYLNGIWIGTSAESSAGKDSKQLNNTYILVEGTFYYTPRGGGHMGLWSGELNDITSLVELPPRTVR